jgi:hypothetical protein
VKLFALRHSTVAPPRPGRLAAAGLALALGLAGVPPVRGEAMLELFNVPWAQLTQKMPELAEAGYGSLWLPNPAKGNSGAYSIGYDLFDPFDLGGTNQQGTVATRWGTQNELIEMVQTAHRFGLRVYFDNVMNHRSATVPGYPGSGTPTNYFPGLIPQDFHLQTVAGGYVNWPSVSDWCYTSQVQNQPLVGLCDLAQEPGTVNWNFGSTLGSTVTKPYFVRFPGRPDLYMNTNGPLLGAGWGGSGWHPFDGQGQPVPEDVSVYLCRAVAWTLYKTRCDGFRLDAVKHVPASFFGNAAGQTDDPAFAGYTGAIQAMYDSAHGYGNNVAGNGYAETDGNRNSLFNTEAPRNDAMIFGEHVSPAPAYYDYLQSGMRLLNQPFFNQIKNAINNYGSSPGLSGMDGRDYAPPGVNCDGTGNYSAAQSVLFSQSQDPGTCCPADEGLQDAYFFMHEGVPMVYADGFNHNPTPDATPIVSYLNYLGEFGDDTTPDTMYTHNQLARGGTWSRWSDQNTVLFERYDYREGTNAAGQDVALFGMNDKYDYPGDISFDDGVTRPSDGYYLNPANGNPYISNSRGVGVVVGFPPGSVLAQLSGSGDSRGGGRAYKKLLVHGATTIFADAQSTANDPNPVNRLIYVGGQSLAPGGGAVELTIPSGAWVAYGYQWPEPGRANPATNALILRQNGVEAPRLTVYRTDGINGDANYNPLFPFKMRGSVDVYGNVIPGVNVTNRTYAIEVPIVTNAPFDIIARCDASCVNTLIKLDGGVDLNRQMGLGPTNFRAGIAPTNFLDLRDNPPGYADDVFLGYEQTAFQFRNGPEKFAARNSPGNNVVSPGAETYYYTNGGASRVISGSGYGASITNQTAASVLHDPTNAVTSLGTNIPTQRYPLNPAAGQAADIWVKVGFQFQINTCYIYYTTDGSNPEGAFGIGKGTTQVVPGFWFNHDSATNSIDWWRGTIPAQPSGTPVHYKVALFNGGSYGFALGDTNNYWPSIGTISDAEPSGSKLYGLTQAAITNFNPATAVVWQHNDLNPANTVTGLQSGFHIVRARAFLPRSGRSSVYNTFLQTFYYDGALPGGVIAYPFGGDTLSSASYTVVVRTDGSVTGVDFNIQDSYAGNDDTVTGESHGNGNSNSAPVYVSATAVTPDPGVSAQYPNYPQEFRFNYVNVPASSNATITVRLKTPATEVYPNRLTTLTRTVNTLGPLQYVVISSPAADGTAIPLYTNTTYLLRTCFTATLATNDASLFNIYLNGVLQPKNAYTIQAAGCGYGLRSLFYNWTAGSPGTVTGTNLIQVVYSNSVTSTVLSDVRTAVVPPPLRISGLADSNQLVIWDSAPGLNYQVLATTNLAQPFVPVSGIIPGQGGTTSFYDASPAAQKFYQIKQLGN